MLSSLLLHGSFICLLMIGLYTVSVMLDNHLKELKELELLTCVDEVLLNFLTLKVIKRKGLDFIAVARTI